jgi:hypothetical protein
MVARLRGMELLGCCVEVMGRSSKDVD